MEQPAALNPRWRKSSYSSNGGESCVEVGATPWRKSTYSSNGGVDCVQAAHLSGVVLVRDTTQHGTGPVLRVTRSDWARLTAGLRVTHPTATPPL